MSAPVDKDLIDVTARLGAALKGVHGKLRASDAILLAGFARPSRMRTILVARAMQDLGWTRGRYRFNGHLESAFSRGSALEREYILDVEYEDEGQRVLKKKEP